MKIKFARKVGLGRLFSRSLALVTVSATLASPLAVSVAFAQDIPVKTVPILTDFENTKELDSIKAKTLDSISASIEIQSQDYIEALEAIKRSRNELRGQLLNLEANISIIESNISANTTIIGVLGEDRTESELLAAQNVMHKKNLDNLNTKKQFAKSEHDALIALENYTLICQDFNQTIGPQVRILNEYIKANPAVSRTAIADALIESLGDNLSIELEDIDMETLVIQAIQDVKILFGESLANNTFEHQHILDLGVAAINNGADALLALNAFVQENWGEIDSTSLAALTASVSDSLEADAGASASYSATHSATGELAVPK